MHHVVGLWPLALDMGIIFRTGRMGRVEEKGRARGVDPTALLEAETLGDEMGYRPLKLWVCG